MKVPLLSIIIPAYNAARPLRRIVTAILAESFIDFELIIVDDGSKDDTLKVARGLAAKDKRVVVRAQRNGGPSSARNTGLKKARGTYIQFYDADDMIIPGALQKIIDTAERSNADMVVSGWQVSLPNKEGVAEVYKEIRPEALAIEGAALKPYIVRSIGADGRLYNLWNKLFRADIIREHNLMFRDDVRFGEDLIFSFHFFRHARKLVLIPDLTYTYVSGSDSSVFSASSLIPEYREVNDRELLAYVGDNPSRELSELMHWVRWRWLLSYWRIIAQAPLSRDEKLRLIKAIPHTPYITAQSDRYIGRRHYRLERLLKPLLRSPRAALAFAGGVSGLRRGIIWVKQTTRKLG